MHNQVQGSSWLAKLSQARHIPEQKQKDHEDQAPNPYLLNCTGLQHFLEWQLLPGWIKTAWDGISFSWPKLNRHVVLWVAMATWKGQTTLLSCLLSVLEFLLSLSVEASWVQDWPVLPWTNSLELKRCCQASTSNGSICDLISIH